MVLRKIKKTSRSTNSKKGPAKRPHRKAATTRSKKRPRLFKPLPLTLALPKGWEGVRNWVSGLFVTGAAIALVIWGSQVNPPIPGAVQLADTPHYTPFAQVVGGRIEAEHPSQGVVPSDPSSNVFVVNRGKAVAERIHYWSQHVLYNRSYKKMVAMVGNPPRVEDSVPLIDQKFDCTTYVETVIALARAQSTSSFFDELKRIRYFDGKTDFVHRNHFPEADWVPNNIRNGVLAEWTEEVSKNAHVDVRYASKTIDRSGWIAKQIGQAKVDRGIASANDRSRWSHVNAKLPYLPLETLEAAARNIPDGSVLNIVREDRPGFDVMVSHQGFVIHKADGPYFRHANPSGRIKTEKLLPYLAKKQSKKWRILGVNINVIKNERL